MTKLDRTEQRIVGVLIEKQLAIPDSYPMTENALVDGCNQKSNRDPITFLEGFEVAGALMSLLQKGVAARIDGTGRAAKYRHKLDEWLRVDKHELAVLAELLLRGAQAPGALKPRVARMGYHASPEQIEQLLRAMAARAPSLVEQLALGPRERDRRWRHCIGDGSEAAAHDVVESAPASARAVAAGPGAPVEETATVAELRLRVAMLEAKVESLEAQLARLMPPRA